MDSYGVRRSDTTKGPPLRILSLDGGGVRGYSMLIIIQELMHRTFVEIEGRAPRRHEIPKPCDHFDLIVGTGTGGLIAIMLGRLRLDLETCKELYVRLTKMVFETDKTIAGIPYRSTLFKASKLEEAIKQGVWEHTVNDKEGNDSEAEVVNPLNSRRSGSGSPRRHSSNASTISFSARHTAGQVSSRPAPMRYGNGNARLYDARENRCKTAVTAMYKGSARGTPPVLLRSYDSRKEPPPEFDCKIWQAGRATCSIGLAFKPVQIGQSLFHDDGAGTFNPAPEALDEAVLNEWPGRDVGVFVSVGTGKRPRGSDANQQVWYEGFLGEFAEARRKMIAKIEGCEKIHEYMIREHLAKRGVNVENYFRLNVEVGVGEFGMNEWNRLSDISTGTRRYMSRMEEQKMIHGISTRLAKIHKAKVRWERKIANVPQLVQSTSENNFEHTFAVELPGDSPVGPLSHSPQSPPSRSSFDSAPDSLHLQANTLSSPRASGDLSRPGTGHSRFGKISPYDEKEAVVDLTSPSQYKMQYSDDPIAITSPDEEPRYQLPLVPPPLVPSPLRQSTRPEPPPLPPKTPLAEYGHRPRDSETSIPPYPIDDEECPPPVNMARKPDYLQY
ncbi:FabD/lysophospholipase-like protein [Trichoderma citrinoviride]|uniref:FabD/lysophospholipase-like protein n=1 Tax=Trichoderma citrinoviride TaxID=58853 RepID=A0A2T4AYD4_9HYPO|nr:FabD/lysophospholipase-like protein [Trichoderma citrinoviride]PTB62084.1 FabD/lysophospholipase-like protein [Trichoderma citrinoviride]